MAPPPPKAKTMDTPNVSGVVACMTRSMTSWSGTSAPIMRAASAKMTGALSCATSWPNCSRVSTPRAAPNRVTAALLASRWMSWRCTPARGPLANPKVTCSRAVIAAPAKGAMSFAYRSALSSSIPDSRKDFSSSV